MTIDFRPLTPDCWVDFEQLFGPRGACAGCWCMFWKLSRKEFDSRRGDSNRKAQKAMVDSGRIPGLIAYMDGLPAGWIAVEPRSEYPALARSRILKPLDDLPVWSVTCFFVARNQRAKGLTVELLNAATEHVRLMGGKVIEGYPVESQSNQKMPPVFVYTGLTSAFIKSGFLEVARRSPTRPIMRRMVHPEQNMITENQVR